MPELFAIMPPGVHQFAVIDCGAAGKGVAGYPVEHEARIGGADLAFLEYERKVFAGQQTFFGKPFLDPRAAPAESAHQPVQVQGQRHRNLAQQAVPGGQESEKTRGSPFRHVPDHLVAGGGEAVDRRQVQGAQVQESAPDHHRRGLARAAGEIALVDQQDAVTLTAKPVIQAGAIDAAADNRDVECFPRCRLDVFFPLAQMASPRTHGSRVFYLTCWRDGYCRFGCQRILAANGPRRRPASRDVIQSMTGSTIIIRYG